MQIPQLKRKKNLHTSVFLWGFIRPKHTIKQESKLVSILKDQRNCNISKAFYYTLEIVKTNFIP